jgi:acetylornithine deacetylase/succinyl-diaminopimelate desuccinylase-like protein
MPTSIEPQVPRERLIEWLQRFVRFPSEWGARVEEEPPIRAFIRDCAGPLVAELGLRPRYDSMGNMIIELGRRDSSRHLLFATYAQTHPAASMVNPFAAELIDLNGKQAVRGRGISEQKAGIVAALAAVHARHARGEIDGALTFVLTTAGEAGRHNAIKQVWESLDRRPQMAIIALGTSQQASLGNKGRWDINIRVRGRSGHSSMPWTGVDAIAGAVKVLQALASLDLGTEEHAVLGRPTLTATAIESFPKASHTVQGEVRITLDLRLLPGVDPDAAFAKVASAVSLPAPWQAEVSKGAIQYPSEISRDSELVNHILGGCREAGLPEPAFYYSHVALDAGYFTMNGCAATMWGPGEVEMAHTNEESVLVEDVQDIANAYLGTIKSYLG